MLASVDKRFVLLSNPKTGTTALEAAFEPFANFRLGGTPKWKHVNFDGMTEIFGDYFQRQGCTIYGVVRHPVDALASWYRYRNRKQLKNPKHRWNDKYAGDVPFSQFVAEWAARSTPRARVPVSVKWCLTRRGKPAPMTFYRYEDIPLLFDRLSQHVGKKVKLEKLNVSPSSPLDMTREEVAALPEMRAYIDLYESIPCAGR
jgi:hypothetical protein